MSQAGATEQAGEEIREAPESGSVTRPRRSALRRFFLLEEEIAEAEARRFSAQLAGYAEYARAREALEAVSAVLAPREPLRASDGTRAASTLAREAVLFAVSAHLSRADSMPTTQAPIELWRSFSTLPIAADLESALGRDVFLHAFELLRAPELSLSSDPIADKSNLALLRDLASRLLQPLEEATRTSDRVRIRRFLRIGTALALAIALATASLVGFQLWLRGNNLALNRQTSASSAYGNQKSTSGVVDGIKTVHGFHTDEEQNPWLLIDLGSSTKVGSVVVYNRTDCCEDRAAPLVIEASADGHRWKEVARRDKKFSRWKASFPTTEARFVRLTIQKKTWFHLNEVEIYQR